MKALFAAFAVAVVAGFAAATPASAQTVDKQCLVLDYNDHVYNICTCSREFGAFDSIKDELKHPVSLATCSGVSLSTKSSSGGKDPHDHHGKSISKASSSSKTFGIATGSAFRGLIPPFAFNHNSENTKSFATGNGEATANASASGIAVGADVSVGSVSVNGGVTYGETSGNSNAGNGANSN